MEYSRAIRGVARRAAGLVIATSLIWAGAAAALPSSAPSFDTLGTPAALESPPRLASPHRQDAVAGNPLWAIPLNALAATRERPLFSPSRRPKPPAAPIAAVPPPPAPAKPAEPEHPPLTLVGTIVTDSGGIAIFLDQATKNVVRLRAGQQHGGWVLREVRPRDVVFRDEKRSATLSLPAPVTSAPEISAQLAARALEARRWLEGEDVFSRPPKNAGAPVAAGKGSL